MFIAHLRRKCVSSRGAQYAQLNRHFAPPELSSSVWSSFYKHLVPPGLKTRTSNRHPLFVARNLKAGPQRKSHCVVQAMSGTLLTYRMRVEEKPIGAPQFSIKSFAR